MKTKKAATWGLTLVLLMALVLSCGLVALADEGGASDGNPAATVLKSSTMENQNQEAGIVYTKTAQAKSDGTIDIIMTAYTTGEVRQTNTVTPTDIVLVLDVSGSMEETYTPTRITGYNAVDGKQYTYTTGSWWWSETHTAYGMENTNTRYYVNIGDTDPVWMHVRYVGRDANGYEMYEYPKGTTEVIVYPELDGEYDVDRVNEYGVVQLYTATTASDTRITKMKALQNAVNAFIDTTAQMNEGLAANQMHTISIVKYADDSYYQSSTPTTTEGNHKGAGGNSDYNYSEVVKKMVTVDATGAAELKTAVNALDPGGATAIDFGMKLAEAVLLERSEVIDAQNSDNDPTNNHAVDRNEVIIVFTDGEPNHSSGFVDSVANTAIDTAKDMKDAGVDIYSSCINTSANELDLDANINKFMHYLSSNYPTAASMTDDGDNGRIYNGYYKTVNESATLTTIFESIIEKIDRPTVELGKDATMVDVVSPYFDVPQGANVELYTRARNANGTWGDLDEDKTLTANFDTVHENRLTVTGFDFDANYVSETARKDAGGNDFYGKQLVVKFTVTPNYDQIDRNTANLTDGSIPTNEGNAQILNSAGAAVAVVASPELNINKITYKIDGEPRDYATFYRFAGTKDINVIAKPVRTGYTFSGWTTDDVTVNTDGKFTMPDKDVVIEGAFEAKEYNVIYVLDGVKPDGVTLPETKSYAYNTEVEVEGALYAPGYTFSGWYTDDAKIEAGKFTMPADAVEFYGSFERRSDIEYKVEHYLEKLEGDTDPINIEAYNVKPASVDTYTGVMEGTVQAAPKHFDGYTFNTGFEGNILSGEITVGDDGKGTLVLKLYYKVNRYNVTYSYWGDIPRDELITKEADLKKDYDKTNVKYGTTIQLAPAPEIEEESTYHFGQWNSGQVDLINGENNVESFIMPATDVYIVGNFIENAAVEYRVEHYLADEKGEYPATPERVVKDAAPINADVYVRIARVFQFPGYKFNAEYSIAMHKAVYNNNEYEAYDANYIEGLESGETIGALKLRVNEDTDKNVFKLYYTRDAYSVTYKYTGTVLPENRPALPTVQEKVPFGATVKVETEPKVPGYTFTGWTTTDATIRNVEDGKEFTMPAQNVELTGYFTPTTVIWKEEHYLQNADGIGYKLDDTPTGNITHRNMTGAEVTVNAGHYPGYELNVDKTNTENGNLPGLTAYNKTIKTTVLADGSLVVKFYYDRNKHDVTYQYEGTVPTGALSVPGEATYLYGYPVPVANEPAVPGYTFSGWKTTDATITNGEDGKEFEMPDKDVVLKGSFTANKVDYTVKYWLQNLNAGEDFNEEDYTEVANDSYDKEATVGQHVEADLTKTYTGFAINNEHSKTYGHVSVDGDGVGNLVLNVYYDRNVYDVTYGYYSNQPKDIDLPVLIDKNMVGVPYGKTITIAGEPDVSDYTFDGWYTHTANVVKHGEHNDFVMPAHNVAFLGRFLPVVEYDLNGGTGAAGVNYDPETVPVGTEITVKAAPTRSGYTFKGWKEADATYAAGDKVTVERNMKFIAQWTRNGGGGGGGTTKYTLTYETNGGNTIPKEVYESGTVVKLTKLPVRDDFVFEGWHLDSALTQDVDEVKMTKNITVYAAWVTDNGSAGNGHKTPDSLNGKDHFAYVVGYPDDTVRPNANITRAEVTTIFFRLLVDDLREKNLSTTNNFDDVISQNWHNTAVSTMAKMGIVKGRTVDNFAPDAFITRAEFAAICARFDDSDFVPVDDFKDIKGHWAEKEIQEAAAYGWIRGYDDKTFRPDAFITRAEAMTMINRVLNRVPETPDDLLDDMIKWVDNANEKAWYYIPVQEATNSHDYEKKNNIYETWTAITEPIDWTKYEN